MDEITLRQIVTVSRTESLCNDFVKKARWLNEPICPRCNDGNVTELRNSFKFQCNHCHYQFSVKSKTFLHKTNLPLHKWIIALYLIDTNINISVSQLSRDLILPYKTVWRMKNIINQEQISNSSFNLKLWLKRGLTNLVDENSIR